MLERLKQQDLTAVNVVENRRRPKKLAPRDDTPFYYLKRPRVSRSDSLHPSPG
jgi:hypothetical protein